MKRVVLSIMAAAILIAAASAASSVLPQTRRTNGDPDEFQARHVFDEGFTVRDSEILTGTDHKPTPPESGAVRPGPRARTEKAQHAQFAKHSWRPFVSVGFSGRIIFLER